MFLTFFSFDLKSTNLKSTYFRSFCTTTKKQSPKREVGDDQNLFFEAWQARDGALALITGTNYENTVAQALQADGFTVDQQKNRIDLTLASNDHDAIRVEVKSKEPFTYGETTLIHKEGIGYVLNNDAKNGPQGSI